MYMYLITCISILLCSYVHTAILAAGRLPDQLAEEPHPLPSCYPPRGPGTTLCLLVSLPLGQTHLHQVPPQICLLRDCESE